jgi:tetratricopeptide (TPR) repeat protein
MGDTEAALLSSSRATRGSPRDPDRYLAYLGVMNGQFAAGKYEECIAAAEQAIILQPNFYGGYYVAAAAAAILGRAHEAEEFLAHVGRLMPRLTLNATKRNPLFMRPDDIDRLIDGLRLAGLPD